MKGIFTLAIVLLGICTVSFGAGRYETAKKIEAEAQSYYEIDEYAKALPLYQRLDSLIPGNPDYAYKIGVCLYNSIDKKKSLDYFLRAKKNNVKSETMNFFLARAYHFNNNFDSAIYYYNAYSAFLDKEKLHSKKSKEELARFIKNCENGKSLLGDTMEVNIENIGKHINSKYPDYAPVVSADDQTLYFTSRREGTTGGGSDLEDNMYFEDIYMCTKQANGQWSSPVQLGPPINTPDHDACIGLSPDGQKMFIYKSDKNSKSGDIFISEIKNGTYTEPVKLAGGVNTNSRWENSSSITTDDKVLFFTSNRRGGYGGLDIYISRRLPNGEWSAARNLGPTINTPADEDAPQIHSDGKTLFFSSKGHNSIGGFDIFSSVFNPKDSSWSTPKNLGFPVNSADDDIYFNFINDGSKGYFSSYRDDSYGEKDIYVVKRPKASASMLVMRGKILDKETKKPIAATITLVNKENGQTEQVANSQASSGRYSSIIAFNKNYVVTVSAKGYYDATDEIAVESRPEVFDVAKSYALDKAPEPVQADTTKSTPVAAVVPETKPEPAPTSTPAAEPKPEPVAVAKPAPKEEPKPVAKAPVDEVINFKNIYFAYKVNDLPSKSKKDLAAVKKYLASHPDAKIRIIGYADSIGSEEYNQKLSQKRAESIAQYLVKLGVNEAQLLPEGRGELDPEATNATLQGRARNRRVVIAPEK